MHGSCLEEYMKRTTRVQLMHLFFAPISLHNGGNELLDFIQELNKVWLRLLMCGGSNMLQLSLAHQ